MTTTTISNIPKRRSLALILSPIGLLLLSAARLIIVSDYNTTTAVTIASSGGYINTLLGSVIPLVPIFAPYLALVLLLFKRFLLSIMMFVFAAFITPSTMTLPQVISLAMADWHHLVQVVLFFPLLHSQLFIAFGIVVLSVLIIGPLLAHHRELAEVAGLIVIAAVAAALLIPKPRTRLSTPTDLRLESASASLRLNENHAIALTATYWPVAIAIALSIALITAAYQSDHRFSRLLSATVAIVATFALFPYVTQIYPISHHSSYYSQVLHEVWLPAEKIVTKSGHVYYGYILSSDPHWETVLRTNRKIAYLLADEVVRRSVCQPRRTPEPAPHAPLIPLLYTKPKPTRPCAPIVTTPKVPSRPTIHSLVSHGESLKAISSMVGTWPWHIKALTNAVERNHLSPALQAYENAHNWFAPTPIGQRFWYPPRLPSASESRRLRHGSRRPVPPILVPHVCYLRPVC